MKSSHLVICTIAAFWIKGVYLNKQEQVFQSPRELLVTPNTEVNMTMSHKIQNYDTILWYQRSPGDTALKLVAYMSYTTPKVETAFEGRFSVSGDGEKEAYLHILKPKHPEDTGEYFGAARTGAEAHFGAGTKLTVLEQGRDPNPPEVKILPPSPKECRNSKDKKIRKKTLVCVASGFYPDHVSVSWEINDKTTNIGVATDNYAKKDGDNYRITSRLRVLAKDWEKPTNKFTCIVNFFDGKTTTPYPKTIDGVEAVKGDKLTRDEFLRGSQNGKLCYGVFIVKSCIYGAFVTFLVWKLQSGKQSR